MTNKFFMSNFVLNSQLVFSTSRLLLTQFGFYFSHVTFLCENGGDKPKSDTILHRSWLDNAKDSKPILNPKFSNSRLVVYASIRCSKVKSNEELTHTF